jgi:hypothetical protein
VNVNEDALVGGKVAVGFMDDFSPMQAVRKQAKRRRDIGCRMVYSSRIIALMRWDDRKHTWTAARLSMLSFTI